MDTILKEVRDDFINNWGAMGSSWGINRTMAQIHAFLLMSKDPVTTDDVMEELKISRGNANTNLRELVGWRLIRNVVMRGHRKEFFEAEKDVWKMFCCISRERKRREIEPVLKVLNECQKQSNSFESEEAKNMAKMFSELGEFIQVADTIMDKVSQSEKGRVLPSMVKFFS